MFDLYRENLLDHYKNPRNFGKPDFTRDYSWEEFNPSCGDKIGMALKLDAEKKKVVGVSFWGEGCVVSTASASMLTEKILELKDTEKLKVLKGDDILKMLGGKEMIPPARLRCAFLSLEVMRRALGIGKGEENGLV